MPSNHLEWRRIKLLEGNDGDDFDRKEIASIRLTRTKSITLIERAHAHAVPRATSTLMVVL